jgi:hypothetical protein
MPRGRLRRTAGAVVGTTLGGALVLAGLVMLATPGPGLLTIAAGSAVLSRHSRLAARLRDAAVRRLRGAAGRTAPAPEPPAGA